MAITGDYNGLLASGTTFTWSSATTHGFDISASCNGISIDGLVLQGGLNASAPVDGNYHAINTLAKGNYTNLYLSKWPGDGLHGVGSTPASNLNGCLFQNLWGSNCQWTINVQGADANACSGYNVNALLNRRGCIFDRSFLGNYWAGGSVETCGNMGVAGFQSRCEKNGHIYVVAYGQEAWCSTNAPTETTPSNQGWLYLEDGTADVTRPTWTTGQTWYWAAALASQPDNNNMWARFEGFYLETNVAPVILSTHSTFHAIFPGRPVWTVDGKQHGGVMVAQGSTCMEFGAGLKAKGDLTVAAGNGYPGSVNAAGNVTAGAAIIGTAPIYSTGAGFRAQGSAYSGNYGGAGLEIGYYGPYGGYLQARTLPADTTLPFKAICASFSVAAGASGTPSDVFSVTSSAALSTVALGYAAGAGGIVTQATNRTTGVTLNKACGAITLASAAGSTSWQTFTVTNSVVAATDNVRVVQKSGADKYQIHVTAVAAGSFDITFATTGGTTTEQPVFNFAVIKGVTS
jgi:hypothetical protein